MYKKFEAAKFVNIAGSDFVMVWATDENGDRRHVLDLWPDDVVSLARQLLRWAPGQED